MVSSDMSVSSNTSDARPRSEQIKWSSCSIELHMLFLAQMVKRFKKIATGVDPSKSPKFIKLLGLGFWTVTLCSRVSRFDVAIACVSILTSESVAVVVSPFVFLPIVVLDIENVAGWGGWEVSSFAKGPKLLGYPGSFIHLASFC